jgi:plasmid stabilization system protein ParE
MSGYVLGRDAEQDLDDLWGYIAADSVNAADRLTARFFEAFEALARSPGMGHKRKISRSSRFFFGRWATTWSSTGPRVALLKSSPSFMGNETFPHSCAGEAPNDAEGRKFQNALRFV